MKNFADIKPNSSTEDIDDAILSSSMSIWSPAKIGAWSTDIVGSNLVLAGKEEACEDYFCKNDPTIPQSRLGHSHKTESAVHDDSITPYQGTVSVDITISTPSVDQLKAFSSNSDTSHSSENQSQYRTSAAFHEDGQSNFKATSSHQPDHCFSYSGYRENEDSSPIPLHYDERLRNLFKETSSTEDSFCLNGVRHTTDSHSSSVSFNPLPGVESIGQTSVHSHHTSNIHTKQSRGSKGFSNLGRYGINSAENRMISNGHGVPGSYVHGINGISPDDSRSSPSYHPRVPESNNSIRRPSQFINDCGSTAVGSNFKGPLTGMSTHHRAIVNGRRMSSFDSLNDRYAPSTPSYINEYEAYCENSPLLGHQYQQFNGNFYDPIASYGCYPERSSSTSNKNLYSDVVGMRANNHSTNDNIGHIYNHPSDLSFRPASSSVDDLCANMHLNCNINPRSHIISRNSLHSDSSVTYDNLPDQSPYHPFPGDALPAYYNHNHAPTRTFGRGRMSGNVSRSYSRMVGPTGGSMSFDFSTNNSGGSLYHNQYREYIGSAGNHGNGPSSGFSPAYSRDALLDEFRSSPVVFASTRQPTDIVGHVVSFSRDQHGSRYVQQVLDSGFPKLFESIFREISEDKTVLISLVSDVFGNYVVQKLIEHGQPEHISQLMNCLKGNFLDFSMHMYGCRVVQKAIESPGMSLKSLIIMELDGKVHNCILDQNGNHVIQKCIEKLDPSNLNFIIDAFRGKVIDFSTHSYGCRVIQRLMEYCSENQISFMVDELVSDLDTLIRDQYGNYVIQHILERNVFQTTVRIKIIELIKKQLLNLSMHKFASNVVEKCFIFCTSDEKNDIMMRLVQRSSESREDQLLHMMKDQYGNFVIQKVLDTLGGKLAQGLLSRIHPYYHELKKCNFGKHLVPKLEQLFSLYNISSANVPDIQPCDLNTSSPSPHTPAPAEKSSQVISSDTAVKLLSSYNVDDLEYIKEFPLYSAASSTGDTAATPETGTPSSSINDAAHHKKGKERSVVVLQQHRPNQSSSKVVNKKGKMLPGKQGK